MRTILAFLAGYLLAALVLPTLDVARAVAEPTPAKIVVGKYNGWNRIHPKEVHHASPHRRR